MVLCFLGSLCKNRENFGIVVGGVLVKTAGKGLSSQ